MKSYKLCMSKLHTYLLLCIFGLFAASSASAGLIIASGDSTPAFYAADSDNDVFFANILAGGTSVLGHELSNSSIGMNLSGYYNSLTGVSSTYLDNSAITAAMLTGVDLFITGLREGGLSTSELSALTDYVNAGGSVMFMGEYTYPFDSINAALASIGSGMSLVAPLTDIGTHPAGVVPDALTTGVTNFSYGYTYGVLGGTALFTDSTGRTFMAYESTGTKVPEPSSLLLFGTALLGLAFSRKKHA